MTFRGGSSNYKSEVFISDFDGYPINGSTGLGFTIQFQTIILNTDIHRGYYMAVAGPYAANFTYLNRISCTYVLIDLTSFIITPITQGHINAWLSVVNVVYINKDFEPLADKKCMLGTKTYYLAYGAIENYRLTVSNSSNYSLIYDYYRVLGSNLWPSLFCFGYCKEGAGRTLSNTCSRCPSLSTTCSNMSFALTCVAGYYPQPTTIGIQKCFVCMTACRVCQNYSYCIEC
jgi:hypothetical protein